MERISFVLVFLQGQMKTSQTLHIVHPLKMELKNRITKKGMVEALTLSRWLQPFTESDEFDIEKSTIITNTPASFALNNYYQYMLESYNTADEGSEPTMQPREKEYTPEDTEEIREMFNHYYVSALSNNKEKELVQEEISEEELDSLPISDTKH